MKEIWKDISEYKGLYQISNFGRVKSLKRKVYAGRGRMRYQYEKILSDNKTNGNGYKVVSLFKENVGKNHYIHRLVAEAFLNNPQNYNYVNHKDQNTFNNIYSNLEWCSQQYNCTYKNAHIKRGLKFRNNKIKSRKIYQLKDKTIIKEYPSIAEAGRQLNVNDSSIRACLKGRQQTAYGYKWKYAEEEQK